MKIEAICILHQHILCKQPKRSVDYEREKSTTHEFHCTNNGCNYVLRCGIFLREYLLWMETVAMGNG